MRYIDPYKLAQEVRKSQEDNPHKERLIARNHHLEHDHFINMIMRAPSEDVVPIVHGHWIYKPLETDGDLWLYHCSACANLSARPRAYCAECGAKMEERIEQYND